MNYNKIIANKNNSSFLIILLLLLSASVFAQQSAPYLIPRQIYVGDPAALVVPISEDTGLNISVTANLPVHEYIEFHKITLQGDRILIEFTAFAAGNLALPEIEIAGHYIPNLVITVDTTIDRSNAIALSSPASAMVMPGTAIMLYGTMTLLVFILLASIWFAVKGRKLVAVWREKFRRWRLFTSMRQTERRLNKAVLKGTDSRIILNNLSDDFRNFLSILTYQNCRAMTARELGQLSILENSSNPAILDEFFTLCDNYRFSGINISNENILELLKTLRTLISEMETQEKIKQEKQVQKKEGEK